MKSTNTLSDISGKLRETTREAESHIGAAAEVVGNGLRDTAALAVESTRQASKTAAAAAEAAASDAAVVGRDIYKRASASAGDALTGIDTLVSRNPVGALVAALGFGLLIGMLARK